jgi:hypothetical protein
MADVGRRAGKLARRAGGAVATAASEEKHTIAAVVAGAAVGYMQRNNVQVPYISALGLPGTYGVVALGIAKFSKSRVARHVATGLLSVAAYQMTASGAIGGGAQPAQLQPLRQAPQGDSALGNDGRISGAL